MQNIKSVWINNNIYVIICKIVLSNYNNKDLFIDMTIRHMQIFIRVAEEQSVTAAAHRLFISQPAASLALSEIEKEYDIKLFDRVNRKMFMTARGERLYRWTSQILSLMEDMNGDLKNHIQSSKIRLGASTSVANSFLMPAVREFEKTHPGTSMQLTIGGSPSIKEKILKNELDVAITEDFFTDDTVVRQELFKEPIIPICPSGHRFAQKKIQPQQLCTEKVVVREKNTSLRQIFDSIVTIHHLALSPYMESADNQSIILAVRQGLGIAFMPQNLVKEYISAGRLDTFTLTGKKLYLSCRLIHHKQKSLSPSVTSFIEFCRIYGKGNRN